MRTFEIKNIYLGNMQLTKAVELCTSETVLRRVQGDDMTIGEWNGNKRKMEYTLHLPEVPSSVKRFVIGNTIKVDATQEIIQSTDRIHQIRNKIHLNCLGSRFFNISPTLKWHKDDKGDVYFSSDVKVKVWAPPPLGKIAENFMIIQAEKDLVNYTHAILEHS